jgi:hypothetical protein
MPSTPPCSMRCPAPTEVCGGCSSLSPWGENSRRDSPRLGSAYLVAGQLGPLRPSRVGASRLSTRQRVARTLAFLSGAFLVVAYIGASAFPAADLPRYLGLPSAAMLAVFAPYAFEQLRRRRYGALYSLLLVAVAVFSFAYSGVFAPKNPYTSNPYGLSLSGLISYGDAQQIRTISQMLAPGTYLTDWRSGLFMASTYLDIQPQYRGFRYRGIEFIYGGSYGLYIDSAYLQRFSGLIILRQESSNMPEVYSPDVFVVAKNSGNSVFYSSNDVTVWAR